MTVLAQCGRFSLKPNLRFLGNATEREELLKSILKKIEFIDTSFHNGEPIHMLDVTQEAWEAPAQLNKSCFIS